jgi:hypothetical protein
MAYASNIGNIETYIKDVLVSYLNDQADPIMNSIPAIMGNTTDQYLQFDANMTAYRDERKQAKMITGKEKPNEVNFDYTKLTLDIVPYKEMSFIGENDIVESSEIGINQIEDTAKGLATRLYGYNNLDTKDLITDTTIFESAAAGALWGTGTSYGWDTSNGDPQKDINEGIRKSAAKSGGVYRPNTLIIGAKAFDALFLNANIQSRTQNVIVDKMLREEWLKRECKLDQILTLESYTNSAKEGKTPVMTAAMSTSGFLCYLPKQKVINKTTPSAISRITLKGLSHNEYGLQVSVIDKRNGAKFEDGTSGVKIIVELHTNPHVFAADLGFILTGLYTP